ncbi:MAG: glycosyltransferase [Mycobacteriales bacterium]|nr:glycosyltransferase [Mycobacteriales bacterium]
MRLRAVVVNYNGGAEVLGGLRALLASDWPGELEVVVVDNGSTDGSVERIEAELPAVRVHRSPGNLGYPAVNRVVTDLDGVDLVAVVNPDAVVAPDCLRLLADALAIDPGLGAACPLILLDGDYREVAVGLDGTARASLDLLAVEGADRWHLTGPRVRRRWQRGVAWTIGDGSVLRSTATDGTVVALRLRAHEPSRVTLRSGGHEVAVDVDRRATTVSVPLGGPAVPVVQNAGSVIGVHGLGLNRGYHQPDGPTFAQPTDVPAWCGAAVLLRAGYLRDAGLFDPRWFLYYEDTDLSWRGLLRGWRYAYVPEARVRHAHSTTIGHGSALYDVQHESNRLLTVAKCAPAGAARAAWLESVRLVGRQLRGDVVARLRDRRAPEPVLTTRRLRALARALRLLPAVLADRRAVRGGASVVDADLPVLGRWHDPAPGPDDVEQP